MPKITITLETEVLQFIEQHAPEDHSTYINQILKEHRQKIIEAETIAALQEEIYEKGDQTDFDLAIWDAVLSSE
ncbi:MAG: CopG family transcriptional regulator [Pleurocapsa sp.]